MKNALSLIIIAIAAIAMPALAAEKQGKYYDMDAVIIVGNACAYTQEEIGEAMADPSVKDADKKAECFIRTVKAEAKNTKG